MNSVKDKVTVITGASRGLGKSLAEILAAKGAKLFISDRNESELKETANNIGAAFFVADVTNEQDMKNLAKAVIAKFGHIDIWINNAGVWLPKMPAEEIDMKKAHGIFEVNVFGTIYGSREAITHMKSRANLAGDVKAENSGMIVNIISTSALQGRTQSKHLFCRQTCRQRFY
jgi:NAD(P)-dependent dehydrogenase (short-subunit alcohol dehydrogenase family)